MWSPICLPTMHLCCYSATLYEKDCVHPLCVAGRPNKDPLWFEGGPSLSYLPLPIPDPQRSWGNKCESCSESCVGHYLSPEKGWEYVKANGPGSSVRPPREILKEFAKEADGFSDEDVQSFAKQCLLSEDDVQMWLSNIQRGRKNAQKKNKQTTARKTKKGKKNRNEQTKDGKFFM